jgi:hypothetical protein
MKHDITSKVKEKWQREKRRNGTKYEKPNMLAFKFNKFMKVSFRMSTNNPGFHSASI